MIKSVLYYYYLFVYGQHSKQFNLHCQQTNTPTPYRLCYAEEPEDHILEMFKPNSAYPVFLTTKEIKFSKKRIHVNSGKFLPKDKSLHYFLVSDLFGCDIKLFGYRELQYDFHAKKIYYTVNNYFVFGEFIFLQYSNERAEIISKKMFEEYEVKESIPSGNFYIQDIAGSRILFFNSGFEINLRFLLFPGNKYTELMNSHFNQYDHLGWSEITPQ